MQATVLYGAGDVRFEDRPDPAIVEPTDAVIRLPVHVHLRVGPLAVSRHSTGLVTDGDGP